MHSAPPVGAGDSTVGSNPAANPCVTRRTGRLKNLSILLSCANLALFARFSNSARKKVSAALHIICKAARNISQKINALVVLETRSRKVGTPNRCEIEAVPLRAQTRTAWRIASECSAGICLRCRGRGAIAAAMMESLRSKRSEKKRIREALSRGRAARGRPVFSFGFRSLREIARGRSERRRNDELPILGGGFRRLKRSESKLLNLFDDFSVTKLHEL